MAKTSAAYQRRLARGRAAGLTTAQARRGAKKYATEQPREHVARSQQTHARYGLSPGQLTRVNRANRESADKMHYRDLPFPDIDTAIRWARDELPSTVGSFLAAYGPFRDTKADSKYDRTKTTNSGWAAISSLALPSGYQDFLIRRIYQTANEIFTKVTKVILKVRTYL